ncbi:hypothetical protein NECAME_13637 [Necator americanus]|uniref:glucuronosyltransferase n=1 Tax=Necator americanus TaxID=51031 RepID=W2SUB0_NECAM|nr:hypothetical protein NECAME_13637 [Necator americanus]ETN73108.1 hypothetical protein NECAME_13637 [Necator americanus]
MDMTTQMSYLERVQNIYSTALFIYMNEKSAEETSEVFRRKYGANFPSVSQIAANSDMIFVSTDEFVEFPRPTLPNVVHIGGLGLRETLGNDPLEEVEHSLLNVIRLISMATHHIYYSRYTLKWKKEREESFIFHWEL